MTDNIIITGEMDGEKIWRPVTAFDRLQKLTQVGRPRTNCKDCKGKLSSKWTEKCDDCAGKDWDREMAKEDGKII